MSDKPDDYEERTAGERAGLAAQMQMGEGSRYGGYQYVAPPDEGHDTPGIWLCHFASTRSGYAHVGHALAHAVADHLKLPTQLVPHRMQGISVDDVPEDRREDVTRWMQGKIGLGRALIVTLPPQGAAQMNGYGRTRVVCYATHECDRVSPQTAELCNPGPEQGGFAKIWVKTPFAERSFIAGGVRPERLRVVTPPLLGGPWKVPDGHRGPVAAETTFRFGMLGTWIKRKGFDDLLAAYYMAFNRDDNVVLEIKTSPLNEHETVEQMQTACVEAAARIRAVLGIEHEARARVIFKVGVAETDQEVIDWLASLHCFANSSYGEGLGVPQIYALAAGIPMVTTAFGAVGELVAAAAAQLHGEPHQIVHHVETRIDRDMLAVSRMYDPGQKWGRYNEAEFGAAMRRVYDHGRVHSLECLGTQGYVNDIYSVENASKEVKDALAELVDLGEIDYGARGTS